MRSAIMGYSDYLEEIKESEGSSTFNNIERLKKLYNLSL